MSDMKKKKAGRPPSAIPLPGGYRIWVSSKEVQSKTERDDEKELIEKTLSAEERRKALLEAVTMKKNGPKMGDLGDGQAEE